MIWDHKIIKIDQERMKTEKVNKKMHYNEKGKV